VKREKARPLALAYQPKKMHKILICEDDEGVSELLKLVLEGEGFEVRVMSNSKGIQKKVKGYLPDLLLLDMWIPGVDGMETTKILKKDPQTTNVPIIVISAFDKADRRSKESGADDFIAKPFNIKDLLAKVHKYV
jgi:DNA-binding response OmpR family regulator